MHGASWDLGPNAAAGGLASPAGLHAWRYGWGLGPLQTSLAASGRGCVPQGNQGGFGSLRQETSVRIIISISQVKKQPMSATVLAAANSTPSKKLISSER